MEWIGIGMLLAIGMYLAPIVITGAVAVMIGIASILTAPFRRD